MISVEQLSKSFGALRVLDDINLRFEAAKAYALLGPNGSGKTTLIKSILGLVLPSAGCIRVDGQDIHRTWQYREKIGYMPQIGRYPENISIREVLGMVRDTRPQATTVDEELVAALQLDKILDKPMHTLSGGTRQKVSAVLAFLFDPPILILDEPTAGLDPLSVEILKEKTQQALTRGKLLIITSHIMSDLDDMATELVYLHDGHTLYNDTIAALKVQTGQDRLGKAISMVMRSQLPTGSPSK